MKGHVAGGDPVPVGEHAVQPLPDHAGEGAAKGAQGQGVPDAIFENAGVRSVRFKKVGVLPRGKRSLALHVDKRAVFLERSVFRDPAPAKGPAAQVQGGDSARQKVGGGLNDTNPLPWRCQPLQGARPGVPTKHVLQRALDACSPDKSFLVHVDLRVSLT